MRSALLVLLVLLAACPMPNPAPDLGANQCTVEHPCMSGICYAPGAFIGCGACRPPPPPGGTCQMDSDCAGMGAGYICDSDPRDCFCTPTKICRQGCTADSMCGTGQVCGADHRCAGKPCAADTDCPDLFTCATGRCARKSCTGTANCGDGLCVLGNCYDQPGFCSFPPP